MGDKPYNKALFKAASKIIRRNRKRERNYMEAQQKAQMWGQLGNAVTGVTGAFLQKHQMDKKNAAAATLGAEFGLDPETSAAIGPQDLAKAKLQNYFSQRSTPYDEARVGSEKAQGDYYAAQAARERWLMTPEGIEATRRVTSGSVPKDYTQAHIAAGLDPAKAAAFKDIAPPSSAVYPRSDGMTEAQMAAQLQSTIAGDEMLARGQARTNRALRGEEMDMNDPAVMQYLNKLNPDDQVSISKIIGTANDRRSRATNAEQLKRDEIQARRDLEALKQQGAAEDRIAAAQARVDGLTARLMGIMLGGASDLGYLDAYGNPDVSRIAGTARSVAGQGITVPQGTETFKLPGTMGTAELVTTPDAASAARVEQAVETYVNDAGEEIMWDDKAKAWIRVK